MAVITEILSERLGRRISPAEIGFPGAHPAPARLGLEYDPAGAVDSLGELAEADLNDVRTVTTGPLDPHAGSTVALQWLTGEDPEPPMSDGSVRVGRGDIAALRATIGMFSALDDAHGGDHARRSLIEYLRSDARRLLRGRYPESVGAELHRAVAEATLLAAWMTYDAGRHRLAQRYFVQALSLARQADDRLLAASVLDAMSHQATFVGRGSEAASLARAARNGTMSIATPTLTAHFLVMEARGLSAAGDGIAAERALSKAVSIFDKRQPENDPEWIRYFDVHELNAEFSHCYQDLGRHDKVEPYAIDSSVGSPRSDFFVTMLRAAAYLSGPKADPETACSIASEALANGEHLRSVRAVSYVRQVQTKLLAYKGNRAVDDLAEQNAENRMWRAALERLP